MADRTDKLLEIVVQVASVVLACLLAISVYPAFLSGEYAESLLSGIAAVVLLIQAALWFVRRPT